ncbi:FecR domain-containing protein [Massilia sp. erpn]|uniref:FecR family protein n=1 Tax=Massilia sp. erpn TaxID=2738142 RepID=UPI0021073381|nr:FecR domain-containing protein [Massilia sp. erpn]UTY58027.1 hypothetical protein HPQ68_13050 [Massilia sp. erpn]
MPYQISRHLAASGLLLAGLALGGSAAAAEAGRIVFASGPVQSGARALAIGDAVQEGDEISTGAQGYLYLKTVDNGLLILRPGSRARIVRYHVDAVHPANTQVKFELLSGVARAVSGDAVKQARQNFRFNTPVAAIGVRGTDFTVSTDQETSLVTVISGAIVVSGFSGNCMPGGAGPCESGSSRELSAAQAGQMLQVKRGQAAPQLMPAGDKAPDQLAPPRSDEPPGKSAASATSGQDLSLDPKKADNLRHQTDQAKSQNIVPDVTLPPVNPVVTEPAKPTQPPQPASALVWGRWQQVIDLPVNQNNVALKAAGATEVARNSYYTIFRTPGEVFKAPEQGSVSFTLQGSEAFVSNSQTFQKTLAALENGSLSVDFGKQRFSTGFDLLADGARTRLSSVGTVSSDGLLQGDSQYYRPVNMDVQGAITKDGSGVVYIFSTRLDERRMVYGATNWRK